ncbi:MAG TPA: phosphoserine phosphatase SerB [Xanthobacteraceae bacterium]|nr:phosphoserine phosphatase SerB [Xanthobacteraceae bacterium]
MNLVATVISAPGTTLDEPALIRASAALPQAEAGVWLAPGIAADIAFTATGDARVFADHVRDALPKRNIDVVVQPARGRRKRLFLADMDSTMIAQECIDELADFVGKKAEVAAITERAMRGEIAFVPALKERVALLKGLSEKVIDEVLASRITLMPGGKTLIETMRTNGSFTCLVSGGFTQFVQAIAGQIGFDETRANALIVERGKLAGTVADPVFGREGKLATLVELRERLSLEAEETMAIGDGANDLDMIAAAGLGVAFHAKPAVAAAAAARIDHSDLTALLYAQGYHQEEFVERG